MSDELNSPLPPEKLGEINQALMDIKEAKRQAELAKRAGIDVNAELSSLEDSEKKLTQIKQVYFPGQ